MEVRGDLDVRGQLSQDGIPAGSGEFYLKLAHSDGSQSFGGISFIKVAVTDFYLTQNDPNTDEVTLNLRGAVGGNSTTITFAESEAGGFSKASDTLKFDSERFYLSTGGDGNPILSQQIPNEVITIGGFYSRTLGEPVMDITAGSGITLVESEPSGVRTFEITGTAPPGGSDDEIQYNDGGVLAGNEFFKFDESGSADRVLIPFGDLTNPGISFAQDTDTGIYRKSSNIIGFVAGTTNSIDILSNGIRSVQRGTAAAPAYSWTLDTNTGAFLGLADNSYNIAQNGSVALSIFQAKVIAFGGFYTGFGEPIVDLTGGANITVTRDAGASPSFTIAADLSGGTITFAESESGGFSTAADTLKVDSDDFYISTGGDGKPLLSAKDKIDGLSTFIETPSIKNYILDLDAAFEYEVLQVTAEMDNGVVSGGFYINDISIGALDPLDFYTTRSVDIATGANIVRAGDKLTLSVFDNTVDAVDLAFTVKIKRRSG